MDDGVNAGAPRADPDAASTLGLVLNGGLARRIGGADKGLLPLAGRPMIARAIERLRPQCGALAISANGGVARFAGFGLPVLADDPPDFAGPLAGVLAGLEHCGRAALPISHVATLPADAPFAPMDFVAKLHEARRASAAMIAVAASGGRRHHVAALWPVALAQPLRRALEHEGMRKVEDFAARFSVAAAEWPVEPVDPFFNVNTADDLARAEALLTAASGDGP
ncbi:MAG TPA: molybdenum cofactor guanylyltransferase MobA [Roseiarcus sp.]|nr:molybdenum cofactor guanylyltransferase MobA [Roseiarcus sp.]